VSEKKEYNKLINVTEFEDQSGEIFQVNTSSISIEYNDKTGDLKIVDSDNVPITGNISEIVRVNSIVSEITIDVIMNELGEHEANILYKHTLDASDMINDEAISEISRAFNSNLDIVTKKFESNIEALETKSFQMMNKGFEKIDSLNETISSKDTLIKELDSQLREVKRENIRLKDIEDKKDLYANKFEKLNNGVELLSEVMGFYRVLKKKFYENDQINQFIKTSLDILTLESINRLLREEDNATEILDTILEMKDVVEAEWEDKEKKIITARTFMNSLMDIVKIKNGDDNNE